MRGFRSYDKNELFNQIDNLSIERIENQIITKYGGRVIKVANVSNRYEIFDIVKYLISKQANINLINNIYDFYISFLKYL